MYRSQKLKLVPSRSKFCNYFFMNYSPKCYRSKGITIVSITYLTKKVMIFYKTMSKILLRTRNAKINHFHFRDFEANWGQYGLQRLIWGHPYSNIMSDWGLRPWGQKYLTLIWGQIGSKSLIVVNPLRGRRDWHQKSDKDFIFHRSVKSDSHKRFCNNRDFALELY